MKLIVKSPCVAAIQMTSTPHWRKNLEKSTIWVEKSAKKKAQLVCFPENFLLISEQKAEIDSFVQNHRADCLAQLKKAARINKIWILCGSIPNAIIGSQKFLNESILIHSNGKIVSRYSKIHLFNVNLVGDRAYRESDQYRAGKKTVVAKTPLGKLGMSICYDLRFPELYRQLSRKGASLLTVPSAFTVPTGRAHWDILTRARAIENQCYVIAPAQIGQNTPTRKTWGHTRIIDPWGKIIAEKVRGQGIVIARIQPKRLNRIRKTIPALKHRLLKTC